MSNLSKIQAAIAAAAESSADQRVAQAGGSYEIPAEGACRLRLVGYIETGKHTREYKNQPKTTNEVKLVFELSGPKHPPLEADGKKFPQRMTVTLNKSLSERATFFKLFKTLNYDGQAKIFAQLLGKAYKGRVFHDTWKGNDGSERVTATLKNPDSGVYAIEPPFYDDPETGESRKLPVDEPISELRFFAWDTADLEQWDSIFIDGEYPERTDENGKVIAPAKTKNVFQERIRQAENFEGSPIAEALLGRVDVAENPKAEDEPDEKPVAKPRRARAPKSEAAPAKQPATAADDDDPLGDLDDEIPF